jgi:hypothetical protein
MLFLVSNLFNQKAVDLGATWLHDIDNNILATIAQQKGVTLTDTPLTGLGLYNGGTAVDPSPTFLVS